MKTINDNFRDWENHVFGYGYGTGEHHTISALVDFFSLCDDHSGGYDYTVLEGKLTPVVVWLLINTLCHYDIIEYGTSPRFGWLTKKGQALRDFINSKSKQSLIEMTDSPIDYIHCYPDHCNCAETCSNPFWR